MLIALIGSQSHLTDYQQDKLREMLKKLECTELLTTDLVGAEFDANCIAKSEGIKQFTIYPVENVRSRGFFLDKECRTSNNRVVTPYAEIDGVMCKWHPVMNYMLASKHMIDATKTIIACPKEFRHNRLSATWKRIKYVWSLKGEKDLIIIAPISRIASEEE